MVNGDSASAVLTLNRTVSPLLTLIELAKP
jgi:hypothetical protein